jgi:hypothetical protein
VTLAALRCLGAALFLLPILSMRGQAGVLRSHWRAIAWVGLVNSALPFSLYGVALLAINAGLSAIFNAATPLWAAAIGALWLHERLGATRVMGLLIGLAGVAGLAWSKAGFTANEHGISATLAIAACLAATASYGYGGNFTKKHLSGVPPIALATGSQLSAAGVLAVPAWLLRPTALPSATAWVSLALLAVLCTGVGANDAELVLRSLPSLELRYRAQDRSARRVAAWLHEQPRVTHVLHPALPGAPGHEHWASHCTDAAGLFSIILDPALPAARIDAFCEGLKRFKLGYSWAGPVSLAVPYDLKMLRGAAARHDGHLVRFSIGLEAADDLIADLDQALRLLR